MGMMIDMKSYEQLVREDLEWLHEVMEGHNPDSIEGKHIEDVLKCSVCMIYGRQTSLCSRLNCKTPLMVHEMLECFHELPKAEREMLVSQRDAALDFILRLIEDDPTFICDELHQIDGEPEVCEKNCTEFGRGCLLRFLKYYKKGKTNEKSQL